VLTQVIDDHLDSIPPHAAGAWAFVDRSACSPLPDDLVMYMDQSLSGDIPQVVVVCKGTDRLIRPDPNANAPLFPLASNPPRNRRRLMANLRMIKRHVYVVIDL